MNPVASPRHPWKALAAVVAMFALVHGAGAHVFSHGHDGERITFGHAVHIERDDGDDWPDADVRFGPDFPFDGDSAVDAADRDVD